MWLHLLYGGCHGDCYQGIVLPSQSRSIPECLLLSVVRILSIPPTLSWGVRGAWGRRDKQSQEKRKWVEFTGHSCSSIGWGPQRGTTGGHWHPFSTETSSAAWIQKVVWTTLSLPLSSPLPPPSPCAPIRGGPPSPGCCVSWNPQLDSESACSARPGETQQESRGLYWFLKQDGYLFMKLSTNIKGLLSCKMLFIMSLIHKCVSPVSQGTHQVSENKTLSLFLRTQISKNGGTTELIQICCRYIRKLLSERMRNVLEVIWSLFTLAC